MKTRQGWMIGFLAATAVMGLGMSTATAGDALYAESRLGTVSSGDEGLASAAGMTATGGLGIAIGYELGRGDAVAVRPLVMYDVDGFETRRFSGAVRSEWGRQRVMVGADVGYDLFSWLRPMARLAVGYAHQSLALTAGGEQYQDGAHGMSGLAAGGLEVHLGRADGGTDVISRLSMGVNMLVGYSFQTAARFDEMSSVDAPAEPTEDDPWQRATYDAGEIGHSGLAFSMGLSLRYRF